MSLLNTVTMQYITRSGGAYVRGKWTDGSEAAPVTIQGTFQPSKGNELEVLPEGRREKSTYTVYTKTQIKTVNQFDETQADILVKDSIRYLVVVAEPWQNNIINHYRLLVQRETE